MAATPYVLGSFARIRLAVLPGKAPLLRPRAPPSGCMLGEMQAKVLTPDTGSFEGDLAELLASIARVLADPAVRSLFHIMGVRADSDDQAARAREEFWNERFAASGQIVTRAIATGEVGEGVSARAVLELGAAPLFYRILTLREPVDHRAAADIAAWVVGQNLADFPLAAAKKP